MSVSKQDPRMVAGAATVRAQLARGLGRVHLHAVANWALAGGLVLYLGLDGGGYDLVVRSQVGVVVWWLVLVGAAYGLLPARQFTRLAWVALALFSGFVLWTALASTWSLSSEHSLEELSRVGCYLGIFILGLAINRDPAEAARRTVAAIAAAIVLICGIAVLSRLEPSLFPASYTTGRLVAGSQGRLAWPVNYWNALAALVALGLPLLLSIATSARTVVARAVAAGAIPLLALCGYLTFSRGGAIAAVAAVVAFLSLASDRIPKFATALVCATGGAAAIAEAVHRHAIEQGLTDAAAKHQGAGLLVLLAVDCLIVALLQLGIGLYVRRPNRPRWLQVSRQRARVLTATIATVALVVAFAGGAPHRLSRAWDEFKRPSAAVLHHYTLDRFSAVSGSGRYSLWQVAVNATSGHLLGGSGPGTFVLLWPPRAPFYQAVRNAHSLYLETLTETGIVGFALLVGFLVTLLGGAIRNAVRSHGETRTALAGTAAACIAFSVSAAIEWVWQTPVLPAALLLLGGCALQPVGEALGRRSKQLMAAGLIVVAAAVLVAIGVPLATTNDVRASQADISAGNLSRALVDARSAAKLEPGAASPALQTALVLEQQGQVPQALAAARRATVDEPPNWQAWLTVSRLEAEARHARASLAAFRRARSLNPRSPLFRLR